MNWWRRLFAKDRLERELDSELRSHLEHRVRDLVASGLSEEVARRQAMLEFGGMDSVKEDCREARGTKWVEDFKQDLRYAVRVFWRDRLFATVVVLSLALGIGANTALFSLIDARFFRKLPAENPDELVFFRWTANKWTPRGDMVGSLGPGPKTPFSQTMFDTFRKSGDPLSDVFASSTTPYGVSAVLDGQAERVSVQFVSGNFFTGLGIRAGVGRTISNNDDQLSSAGVTMISHKFWRQRFNSDPDVIGRSIRFNGMSMAIVGILPRGFRGVASYGDAASDVWIPLAFARQMVGRQTEDWWLHVMGRMAPGRNADQVRGRLEGTYRGLVGEMSGSLPSDMAFEVHSASRGIPEGGSDSLFLGLVAAGFVLSLLLLIVCLNVANLLLARSAARQQEIETRRAIGANRLRLVRQLLTESVLLALAGGTLGAALAFWAKDLFVLLPSLGEELDLRIDMRVLGFTALVSLITSIVFGLLPAIQATRRRTSLAVSRGVRSFTEFDSRVGKSLLIFQVTISVVLLVGATFLVRMLGYWRSADPGLEAENLLVFQISPGNLGYDAVRSQILFDRITRQIGAIPGVAFTSISDPFFGSGGATIDERVIYGRANLFLAGASGSPSVHVRGVGPDFFEAVGIPISRGRSLGSADNLNVPVYAVIDETLARSSFSDSDPIGRRFGFSAEQSGAIEVVGVAKDVRVPAFDPGEGAKPMVYLPQLVALTSVGHVSFEVRTATDPAVLISAIRKTVTEIDPNLPVEDIKRMNHGMEERLTPIRYLTFAWNIFAGVALLLTCIGLYGLMSYFVERRRKEIGIRIALGARPVEVIRLVMGRCLFPVVVGLVLGLALSWPVHQISRSLIYGKSLYDPFTFGIVASVLLVVASMAGYLPARRASQADPTATLRQE
jgi:predicted permease